MNMRGKNKVDEVSFYLKKLPLPKQVEALDYIKWLWVNVDKKKNGSLKSAVSKIREIQSLHKAYKGWDSVKVIRKWRENH